MANENKDVLRLEDTTANLLSLLRNKQLGFETDGDYRMVRKDAAGNAKYWSPDSSSSVISGSGATDQIAYWTSNTILDGSSDFTFDGATFALTGIQTITNSEDSNSLNIETSNAAYTSTALLINNTSSTGGELFRLRSSAVDRFTVTGAGEVTINNTLDVDGNCTFGNASGDAHVLNGSLTINGAGTQDYKIGSPSGTSFASIKGLTTGAGFSIRLFNDDEDGSQAVGFFLQDVGGPDTGLTDQEYLQIVKDSTSARFITAASGTGTDGRPIEFQADAQANQVYLDTTNKAVSFGSTPTDASNYPFEVNSGDAKFNYDIQVYRASSGEPTIYLKNDDYGTNPEDDHSDGAIIKLTSGLDLMLDNSGEYGEDIIFRTNGDYVFQQNADTTYISCFVIQPPRGSSSELLFYTNDGSDDVATIRFIAGEDGFFVQNSGLRISSGETTTDPGDGALYIDKTDAGTTDIVDMITLERNSSGTSGTGFGSQIQWKLKDDSDTLRDAGSISVDLSQSSGYRGRFLFTAINDDFHATTPQEILRLSPSTTYLYITAPDISNVTMFQGITGNLVFGSAMAEMQVFAGAAMRQKIDANGCSVYNGGLCVSSNNSFTDPGDGSLLLYKGDSTGNILRICNSSTGTSSDRGLNIELTSDEDALFSIESTQSTIKDMYFRTGGDSSSSVNFQTYSSSAWINIFTINANSGSITFRTDDGDDTTTIRTYQEEDGLFVLNGGLRVDSGGTTTDPGDGNLVVEKKTTSNKFNFKSTQSISYSGSGPLNLSNWDASVYKIKFTTSGVTVTISNPDDYGFYIFLYDTTSTDTGILDFGDFSYTLGTREYYCLYVFYDGADWHRSGDAY